MRVLVLGGGGREHALVWKIAQSPLLSALYCAPGNPGMTGLAEPVSLEITSGCAVASWAAESDIDLVVIGPEAPLAAGVADALTDAGIAVFGPSRAAARLESSKAFTKEICASCGAPTAPWARFTERTTALAHVRREAVPIVVKADGLAAGKGVVVAQTKDEAVAAVEMIFDGAFGEAGAEVVIEQFMDGEEASLFVLTDGDRILALPPAQDYKRLLDADAGPNTGGMGACSPTPVMTDAIQTEALERIVVPTLREMARRGTPFRGVLYAGLMIGPEGPRLVEYNVRFGDPECQALMLRLDSDLLPALAACADGNLDGIELEWTADPALTVVLASSGYPGGYDKGQIIGGLDGAGSVEGVTVFHAGTAMRDGEIVSAGGRVLGVTARGASMQDARDRAYAAIDRIEWPGGIFRRDIAWRAID
ncbi:MAG: phosphoribosylamine--glycine ligase [Pseudomonadota bacterium]